MKVAANSPPLGIVIKSRSVSPVLNTKNGEGGGVIILAETQTGLTSLFPLIY